MLAPSSETIKNSDHITLSTEAPWKTGEKVKALVAEPTNGITLENNVLICAKPIVVDYDPSSQGYVYLNGEGYEVVVVLSALSLDPRATLSVRNNTKIGTLASGAIDVGNSSTLKVENIGSITGNISLSGNSTLEINDTPENRKLSIYTDGSECSLVLVDVDGNKRSFTLANDRSARKIEFIVENNEVLEGKPTITQAELVTQYDEKQKQLFDIESLTNKTVVLRRESSEFTFTQLKKIASGMFGEVFLGAQLGRNNELRLVALKYLNKINDRDIRLKFTREIETIISLRKELNLGDESTLIPQVLFVGKNEEGREVFVMNYCTGLNLHDILGKNTLDLKFSLGIMQEIAVTIYAVHQIGKSSPDFQEVNYFIDPNQPEGKRVSSIDYNMLGDLNPESVQRDIKKMANILHKMIANGIVEYENPGNFEYFAKYPELQKFFNDAYQSKFPDVPHFIMGMMNLSITLGEVTALPQEYLDFKKAEFDKAHKKSKVIGNAKTKEEERELFYASGRLKNKKLSTEVRDRLQQKVTNLTERIERIINTPEEPKVEALPVQEAPVQVAQVPNVPSTPSPNASLRQKFIDRIFRRKNP